MEKKETRAAGEAVYTKAQLVGSGRYANRRDLVSALLEEGKGYTLKEADRLIDRFRKGKVQ